MQYEADVLQRIKNGKDAESILHEKFPTMEKRMTSAVKKLNNLLKEVKTEFPDAQFYTASGGLTLMLGSPHTYDWSLAQKELVALSFSHLINIGDGDF